MVGTSGIIFLLMGLRRTARYLVSMSSNICWVKVRSSSRISLKNMLNDVCLLRLQFGRPCWQVLGPGCLDLVAE